MVTGWLPEHTGAARLAAKNARSNTMAEAVEVAHGGAVDGQG